MSLTYRKVSDGSGRFLPWVNDLEGKSGVYVIRSIASGLILYVGESHTGRLGKTLKRHFHAWSDDWTRRHHTYIRSLCVVAVQVSPPAKAITAQNNLILALTPRDNTNGQEANEPDPF